MFIQITEGIKVSVQTSFEKAFSKNCETRYAFRYTVTIENLSDNYVRLAARHWDVYDALKSKVTIRGRDIVSRRPVFKPGETYIYSSSCFLVSPIGAMRGHYYMINLNDTGTFKVEVPTFRFAAPFAIN